MSDRNNVQDQVKESSSESPQTPARNRMTANNVDLSSISSQERVICFNSFSPLSENFGIVAAINTDSSTLEIPQYDGEVLVLDSSGSSESSRVSHGADGDQVVSYSPARSEMHHAIKSCMEM